MEEKSNSIDSAALSAAIVAGAVAIFMTPGPYGWMSITISGTLIAVILGYEMRNARRTLQSLAIATVLAFSSLPTIGLLLEGYLGNWSLSGVQCASNNVCTRVADWHLLVAWLLVSLVFFAVDRLKQARNG